MQVGDVCCPICHQSLVKIASDAGDMACPTCGAPFSFHERVWNFLPQNNCLPSGIKELLPLAQKIGWFAAIREHFSACPERVKSIIDLNQVNPIFQCYEPDAHQACLEIGSRLGTVATSLSRFYNWVYSIDPQEDYLRFQVIRAAQEKINNIQFIRCPLSSLPIPDHSIDLILFNGSLDAGNSLFVPLRPKDITAALMEAKRILKPSGQICLGVSNPIIRMRNNRLFHSPSLAGWERLLTRHGFAFLSSYWTWPGFWSPHFSGSMDGDSIGYVLQSFGSLFNQRLIRWGCTLAAMLPDWALRRVSRLFIPSWITVAGFSPQRSIVQQSVAAESINTSFVQLNLAHRPDPNLRTTFLFLNSRRVVKTVRFQEAVTDSAAQSRMVRQESSGIGGHVLRPHHAEEVQRAAAWLADFQLEQVSGKWLDRELEEELNHLIEVARRRVDCELLAGMLERYRDEYMRIAPAYRIPVVREHGDFTPPNILVSKKEIHVLDWEYQCEHGNPLMDVGAFYLSLIRRSRTWDLGFMSRSHHPAWVWISTYSRFLSLPVNLAPAFYVLRAFQRTVDCQNLEQPPSVYLAVQTWESLLKPTLEFALESGNTPVKPS